MHTFFSTIKTHLEYPIGLIVGFIGQSLGLSKFMQIDASALITERIIDGFIGLFFVGISVVLTHYIKKFLVFKDNQKAKSLKK